MAFSTQTHNFFSLSKVLHVIDDILTPLTVNQGSNEIYNPDAYQFLVNANIFNINPHRVRNFYQRVVYFKSEKLYQADGYHTFFIPVEEGFKVKKKIEKSHFASH